MMHKKTAQGLTASFFMATSGMFSFYNIPESEAEAETKTEAVAETSITETFITEADATPLVSGLYDIKLIADPYASTIQPSRKLILDIQDFLINQGYDQVARTGALDVDTTLALHSLKETLEITPVDNEINEDSLTTYKNKLAEYQRQNMEISVSTLDQSPAGKEYARIVGISANYYIKNRGVSTELVQDIHRASKRAQFDFTYLIKLADAESSLRCGQEASTSSATGCFQFTERTWLAYIHRYGEKYGLEDIASQITAQPARGYYDFTVSDPDQRSSILDLRKDPEIAAIMAAEFARDNYKVLQRRYNGPIGRIEMKAAHVMGGRTAARFLRIKDTYPDHAARDYFPREAQSNPGLFYSNSQPVSMTQLYDRFKAKMSGHNYFAPNPPSVDLALLKPETKTL
ncbi:MAG: hypothetical protein ACQEQL_08610 [Pseudomonadota bacterium]